MICRGAILLLILSLLGGGGVALHEISPACSWPPRGPLLPVLLPHLPKRKVVWDGGGDEGSCVKCEFLCEFTCFQFFQRRLGLFCFSNWTALPPTAVSQWSASMDLCLGGSWGFFVTYFHHEDSLCAFDFAFSFSVFCSVRHWEEVTAAALFLESASRILSWRKTELIVVSSSTSHVLPPSA